MISVLLGGKFIPFTFIIITDVFGCITTVLFCASNLPCLLEVCFLFCLHFKKFSFPTYLKIIFLLSSYYLKNITCTLEFKSIVNLFIFCSLKNKNPWRIWNILTPTICPLSNMFFFLHLPGDMVVLYFPIFFEIMHGHVTGFHQWSMRNRKLKEPVCSSPCDL